MAQIKPKLNLNKTPSIVESNSLVFAKNIRLDVDNSIHRDYGIFPMSIHTGKNVNKLVNYKNIINRILSDVKYEIDTSSNNDKNYLINIYNNLKYVSGETISIGNIVIATKGTYKIIGTITNSNEFYIFINGSYVSGVDENDKDIINICDFIICYDEKEDKFYPCNCNWHWSGGDITGCVINNLLGEKILNIGERNAANSVPFKCINLNKSNSTDDERIYTQTPNIPITNLNYIGDFNYTIPNGVYQFFVRYKIRDNFYTDWFPASKELFVGNKNTTDTSFGTVKFVNTHRDSDNSFKFSVEHLFIDQKENYKSFQIGFILSHDDSILARAWKHFDFNIEIINFDYNARDAYEIEIIDILKTAYQIYDVGNVVSFKNKLYLSNYKETDFNKDFQDIANKVGIEIITETSDSGYGDNGIVTSTVNGESVISGLSINENDILFSGENGIIHQLLTLKENNTNSISEIIKDAISTNKNTGYLSLKAKKFDIEIIGTSQSLDKAKSSFENKYKGNEYHSFSYDTDIKYIKVSNVVVFQGTSTEESLNNILLAIYNKSRYLNNKCVFINNSGIEDYSISIEITRNCSYKIKTCNSGGLTNSDISINIPNDEFHDDIVIGRPDNPNPIVPGDSCTNTLINSTYTQTIHLKLQADITKYIANDNKSLLNYTTLIPYQQYKFYIHFVKQNGEITNGYYCNGATGGVKIIPYKSKVNSIIYPKFTNIEIPEEYVACFFTISHVKNIVATVFNIDTSNNYGEATCMDINVGLIAGNDNLTIKQGYRTETGDDTTDPTIPPLNPDYPFIPISKSTSTSSAENETTNEEKIEIKTDKAKYYYSSDSSDIRYFGGEGIIKFDKESNISGAGSDNQGSNVAYLVNDYSTSEAEDNKLIKCTPFIKLDETKEYSSYDNMNLLGFICAINPIDRERTIKYYTDGSSVYKKKNIDNGENFELVELKDHILDTNDVEERITVFRIIHTSIKYVYSNYNLNYLVLSEDPIEIYKTYYSGTSESTTDKTTSTGNVVIRLFKSLTMSSIYDLPGMYKTYTRKSFITYNDRDITKFNNTIRSSKLEGDEASINIFKFEPNDYYNVPTNRGIIINLISVGDSILVHTEDSMFKFSGSNTLQSSDGEIQPTENNIFDTGISEVFGSDFGFAGLQYKTDHIVTETGYIFFDRDSRIVYMYSGQGQIVKISDSIEKLFKHRPIETIRFANDYYNNRFFISILFYENYTDINNNNIVKKRHYPVTLSFSLNDEVKSFVSLHDFYYNHSFNTKTNCYFLDQNNQDICTISKEHIGCYTKLELLDDKIYIQKKEVNNIFLLDSDNDFTLATKYNINSYDSIIDIINNTDYETIKTLNAIKWCGNKISSNFINIDENNEVTLNMVEEVNSNVPCKYIRIYSDTCMSNLLPCDERSNDKSISELNYYKYPYYNQGSWTFNYFRNILNSKNNKNPYSGDNNSLIEGKYFVIRFIFDEDFKFETLSLNYNIKHD